MQVLSAKGVDYAVITECEGGCGNSIRTALTTYHPIDPKVAAEYSFREGKDLGLYRVETIDPATVRRRCISCGPFTQ